MFQFFQHSAEAVGNGVHHLQVRVCSFVCVGGVGRGGVRACVRACVCALYRRGGNRRGSDPARDGPVRACMWLCDLKHVLQGLLLLVPPARLLILVPTPPPLQPPAPPHIMPRLQVVHALERLEGMPLEQVGGLEMRLQA